MPLGRFCDAVTIAFPISAYRECGISASDGGGFSTTNSSTIT